MGARMAPNSDRRDFVYAQINGSFAAEILYGVANESLHGGRLELAVAEVFRARDALCLHAGIDANDSHDLDALMSAYEDLCYQCGILMYDYGWSDREKTPAG